MSNPTNQMEWLIQAYSKDYAKAVPQDVETIKLSQMVSKLGFIYEKFRNAIDYNEEHLVRRNSLERLLRRQMLFLQESRPQKISQTLIYEFIRARYLPNETLPETLIDDLAKTIEKYLIIIKSFNISPTKESAKLIDWVISVASCEIDEYLLPNPKSQAMVQFMYSRLVEDISFVKVNIEEKEKNLQIYIATLRTLLKADLPYLRYSLLKLYVSNWNSLNGAEVKNIVEKLPAIKRQIDSKMAHPFSFQLTSIIRVQSVFFSVLRELLEKNPKDLEHIFDNPDTLEAKIENICKINYQKIKNKLIGSIFRVILYILLTKTVLAFVLELPYDLLVFQQVNWRALIINVTFHPFLMFLIALTIKVPGDKNTQAIVKEIKKIVYGEERKIVFKPRKALKRGSAAFFVFNFIYLIMFGISFGIVIYALNKLSFNFVSSILFIFFLTVVSFFGFRLRNHAKQMLVLPRKDSFLNFIVDFLSLPIIRVGRFMSANFSKVNIFLYILDFIIETPFKMAVEFLERTVSFIKDKRDEIIE